MGTAADAGYALNLPLRVAPGPAAVPPLVAVDNPVVRVEAVKLADDRSGDVVVRLYESTGGRAGAVLRTGFPLAGATEVDLLEHELSTVDVRDGGIRLALRPFQIMTLRLRRA